MKLATLDTRSSMNCIAFHGQIIDGYNDNTTSAVILDIGTEFRIYHKHGYYTTPKSFAFVSRITNISDIN